MTLEFVTNFYFPQVVLDFLNTPIFSSILWFDRWMIIHFLAGFLLVYLIGRKNFHLTYLILISYEIFELILFNQGLAIPEPLIDTLFDLIMGMMGYYLGNLFHKKFSSPKTHLF
tara:strand:+ start:3127 stop:3468 length:342 start_codon:yes stop_codon:yes gene_type:complete